MSIEDIHAWQLARKFKIAIYELTDSGRLTRDFELRDQLREAAASAPSQIAEGFGRFDPVDFARFVKIGRGSIQECRNHLYDAVDRSHIADDIRRDYDARAEAVLKEMPSLIDYLQSPEARRNAERIRRARLERRRARSAKSEGG
jgi:four helix bundle protein